jgi:hypothetical protein
VGGVPRKTPLIERLERSHRITDAGCWEWTLSTTQGYGQIRMGKRTRRVHQVAWELFRGPVPKGLEIDHECRNRRCFNPEHLRVCTRRENQLAPGSQSVGAKAAAATHCPHGHPYAGENLRIRKDNGKRVCRTCDITRKRGGRRRAP